jgi:uncharacterized membrane protein
VADGRGVAWLCYVPLPGLALAAVLARPGDRLVRFHAWQGTLAILGLLAAGLALLGGLGQLGWGVASAARGRYGRLRPWWDLAALLKRT